MQPAERSPIWITNFEEPKRQEEEQREDGSSGNRESESIRNVSTSCWPIFPAQPEKKRGEERDEPTVVVLLVSRPFAAQMPAKNKPEASEIRDEERNGPAR